jgi:UDP-N-acetylmuramyl pentapeptide phosphotransferase/UDP-N-acetylglucosamine-1-phosphate transferase
VTSSMHWLLALAAAALSALFVGVVRWLAISRGIIDRPTHRGSHSVPTPRGGGLGIVAVVVPACAGLALATGATTSALCTGACAVVAAVGWVDDRRGLSVRARLVAHVVAGVAVGVLATRSQVGGLVAAACFVWWAFCTVASINVVNFMDGINGLVASQIAVFAASAALFGTPSDPAWWYAAVVAAACLGFLPWNFPLARIFLGDVGSGALGFLVPFVMLTAAQSGHAGVVELTLPLVPLFADATVTIFQRWRRGERLSEAHRSHLYQRLANGGWGHAPVTLVYGAFATSGALVAHVDDPTVRLAATVAYLAAVVAAGVALDRRARAVR